MQKMDRSDAQMCTVKSKESWPHIIHITYKTKESIPPIVVTRLQEMNPEFKIHLYGNAECEAFLETYWGQEYAELFRFIPHGPIKSDLWRACILYTYGGVYLDLDVQLQKPLLNVIQSNIDFATSGSWNAYCVNPIIMVSRPRSHILKECAQLMLANNMKKYTYWNYSICPILYQVLYSEIGSCFKHNVENIYHTQKGESVQILSEYKRKRPWCTMWNSEIVLLNHNKDLYDNKRHTLK